MLVAEKLYVGFGSTPVLAGVDLAVAEAETVSIMGVSGAGKSTLLACLAGLVRPDAGQVTFRGEALTGMRESRRSAVRLREFGFVFQFGDLVPELTIVENVELPLRFAGVRARVARRQAHDALGLLGIDHLGDRDASSVSGGELQRAAVARAIVHSPPVLFADEPTGALDQANGRVVLDLLLHAARVKRTSVVVVTHDPAVAQVANRRFVLTEGHLESQR